MDTAGERAPKLGNLPSLMVIRPKTAKMLLHKVAKFYRRLYGGGRGGAHKSTLVSSSFVCLVTINLVLY